MQTSLFRAATSAIDALRALLIVVRDCAQWMQLAMAAIVHDTKTYVLALLRAAYATLPSDLDLDHDHVVATTEITTTETTTADAATTGNTSSTTLASTGSVATIATIATIATVAIVAIVANNAPTTTTTTATTDTTATVASAMPTARRCVLVMSPYTITASSSAAKYDALGFLADMLIPVTERIVCPDNQRALFESYTATSGQRAFPQVFLEDAHDGGHRTFLPLQLSQWTSLEPQYRPTDAQLGASAVHPHHRAAIVFRGVAREQTHASRSDDETQRKAELYRLATMRLAAERRASLAHAVPRRRTRL
jgi:hypothetical protein